MKGKDYFNILGDDEKEEALVKKVNEMQMKLM